MIKKRVFEIKSKNILGNKKCRLWPLASTSLIPKKKRKRGMTLIKLCISTAIKKATLPATAPSQKTSVSFSNFRTSN